MRIIIEIDDPRTSDARREVTVEPAAPGTPAATASGEQPAINAGMAVPLAEAGTGATTQDGSPRMLTDDASGAMSAGAAPDLDSEG
jgi:hypothetical protein